ncbi:beta-lactamase/transpeptidase-like protein [Panaeolus papilionaceus]|nr:beta-lactamase/transpeptidase-like protein [Panaeolus papilionaceus]
MPASLSTEGRRALDDVSRQTAERNTIPAFVYGVSSLEGEIYFTAGGNRVVNDSSSGPIDPDTVFWICSMTKMLGHLAALLLVDRGQLNKETPVADYFPEFRNPVIVENVEIPGSELRPAQTVIRVQHLLNFTSGLVYPLSNVVTAIPEPYTHSYHNDENPHATFFKLVKGPHSALPLAFEPGTDFGYGYSSDVLGFIVEKISGKTLEAFLQENVFQPLGMKTSFYLTPELERRLLPLAHRRDDGNLVPWANHTTLNERDPVKVSKAHLAGVGIYSSLRDYLTLLRHIMQIHAGTAKNPIAKRETILSMFEPALNDKGATSLETCINHPSCQWSTALGVVTNDWPEGRKRGSAFWSGWANTRFHMDPQTGIAAVFGTQIHPAGDVETAKVSAKFERTLYDNIQI